MRFAVSPCGEGAAPRPLIPTDAAPTLSPGAHARSPETAPVPHGIGGFSVGECD